MILHSLATWMLGCVPIVPVSLPHRGDANALPSAHSHNTLVPHNAAAPEDVDQVFFMATHALHCRASAEDLTGCCVPTNDVRLLHHYAASLRQWQPRTRIWMLVYVEEFPRFVSARCQGELSSSVLSGDGIGVWGKPALWDLLPRLAKKVVVHPGLHREPEGYLRDYYWFHSSLLLWERDFRHLYPRLRYVWRFEPDVAFSGRIDQLVTLSNAEEADVLLPEANTRAKKNLTHFEYNEDLIRGLPHKLRLTSLVCIGRYSTRFMFDIMAEHWRRGTIGYEEILLPVACVRAEGCRFAKFQGWHSVAAAKVDFRPEPPYTCEDFLGAWRNSSLELWHPVKNLSCYLEYVEGGGLPISTDVADPLTPKKHMIHFRARHRDLPFHREAYIAHQANFSVRLTQRTPRAA